MFLVRALLLALVIYSATCTENMLTDPDFRLLTGNSPTDAPTEAPSEAPSASPSTRAPSAAPTTVAPTPVPTHVHVEVPAPRRSNDRERIVIDMPGPDRIEYVRAASKTTAKATAKAPTSTSRTTTTSKATASKATASKSSSTSAAAAAGGDTATNSVDAVRARVEASKQRMKEAFNRAVEL